MGKLFLSTIVAALIAVSVGTSVPTSTFEVPRSAADEAKKSAFTKIGEKYYMIEAVQKLNWFGAAHACRRMDAQLAEIETEAEWSALNSYLISQGKIVDGRMWLSGNNLETKKEYNWLSTGQPLQYGKWYPGEPNNYGGNQNCLQLWHPANEFLMDDFNCEELAPYICESSGPKTITITVW